MTEETKPLTVAQVRMAHARAARSHAKPATAAPVAAAKPAAPKPSKMRAAPNWDEMSDEPDGVDMFHVPPELIPDGMDLQWVTETVYGKLEPQYTASFTKRGWTPVHADDFDGIFDGRYYPKGSTDVINLGGQILMARPLEISRKSRAREKREAQLPAQLKREALMSGDIPGVTGANHPSAVRQNKFNKTLDRIEIPATAAED